MRWDLDALKLIARNETVPGVALRDAIVEIEHLQTRLKAKEIIVEQKQARINFLVEKCLSENGPSQGVTVRIGEQNDKR